MKHTLIPFFCLFVCSCAHEPVHITPISTSAITSTISQSKDVSVRINKNAEAIFEYGTDKNSVISRLLLDDSLLSLNLNSTAKTQLIELQNKLDVQADQLAKATERLNYIEPKYSEAVGLLWKWRLLNIASILIGGVLGTVFGIVFWAGFKTWLKTVPIIGPIISTILP